MCDVRTHAQRTRSADAKPANAAGKDQSPSPRAIAEIEDFVDFIQSREQELQLVQGTSAASVPVFAAVWDNPDDDAYDEL
jgi:ABC-type glycerol-3-phosphate transport system substrate-binding protein